MQRIAIDARESGTSTGRYMDKLVEYLHKLEPEYEVVILTKPHRLNYFKKIAPKFEVLETTFKEFTLGEQFGFKKQLENLKPDLVHFTMIQQPVWYKGSVVTSMLDLTTVRFKNPSKNPLVFTLKQQVYKWVCQKVAEKSKYIITISNYVKNDVVKFTHISPSKVVVTYCAADLIKDKPQPIKGLVGKQFIMYVGRPLPHKNLDRLIKAFTLLQENHPDLYLVLAGKKDANYLTIENKVSSQAIDKVIFTDFISDGQLRWLYENCAAYIFPSLSEGFGLPGLEAMAHGALVISSDATCLPEIYGKAALYFYPYHTKAMADTIHEGLTNTALRKKLIDEGKKQVSKYSWATMAEQTLAIYKRILDKS